MSEALRADDLPDLILFDGACALCSAWVQFVIARDRPARWLFVPIQSALGRDLARRFRIDPEAPETNAVVRDGRVHVRLASVEAVLRDWPAWRWFSLYRILPPVVRDLLYGAVARNRYRLFGRTCLRPKPGWANRIIEDPARLPKPQALWPTEGAPPAVLALHAPPRISLAGRAHVTAGTRVLGRALARLAGFPAPGRDVAVTVSIARAAGRETWVREFGPRRLISRITRSPVSGARIRERLLGLTCDIALATPGDAQVWSDLRWAWFGIPIPSRLAPTIKAREGSDENGRYTFAVEVRWMPIGTIIRYEGWLEPIAGLEKSG